ncbi:DUF354 domain-containing protein [Methanococcoides methylutens]|uniref:DUF354 domain-containing protein n=1 Tax=Methanococcoides methylutens TaxID=2226 RepID=UPI00404519CF
MKILMTIGHPGHVHFFKNFIWEMEKKGHDIKIVAAKKDVSLDLLDAYGFTYDVVSVEKNKGYGRIKDQILLGYDVYKVAKKFQPDIIVGIGGTAASYVSRVTKAKSIIFTDTEYAKLANKVTFPVADVICTPSCYREEIGNKQVRYNGHHELAYLHPNYFTPDPDVLNEFGLKEGDKFIILRFISWCASHDVGHHGIQNKLEFVKELEKYARVLITSEGELDAALENNRIKISPEKLHDLLYYASLYVGEGGTTASEAATLGTHALQISTNAKDCGVFNNLHDYGLMWMFDDENGVIDLAKELLQKKDLWKEGKDKRDTLVAESVNVTDFMVWLIDNYPQSLKKWKKDPNRVGDLF